MNGVTATTAIARRPALTGRLGLAADTQSLIAALAALGLAIASLLAPAPPAGAADLIAFAATRDGGTGTLDITTGVYTPLSSVTGDILFGMGFGTDGRLYATGSGSPTVVYSINTHSGVATPLGDTATAQSIGSGVGIEGLIYNLSSDPSSVLSTIDPQSLDFAPIGSGIGFQSDGLVALDAANNLYTDMFGSTTDVLASVNLQTGVATTIGSGIGAHIYAGGFANDGTLYGVGLSQIYTIDRFTGVGTLLRAVSGAPSEINALAFENPPGFPTYELGGVGFGDGGTATGTIVVSGDGASAIAWRIHVSGGDETSFPPLTYTSSNSAFLDNGSHHYLIAYHYIAPDERDLKISTDPDPLLLGPAPPIPLNLSDKNWATECLNCIPARLITSGSLLPEPDQGGEAALFALGALTLAIRRRKTPRPG